MTTSPMPSLSPMGDSFAPEPSRVVRGRGADVLRVKRLSVLGFGALTAVLLSSAALAWVALDFPMLVFHDRPTLENVVVAAGLASVIGIGYQATVCYLAALVLAGDAEPARILGLAKLRVGVTAVMSLLNWLVCVSVAWLLLESQHAESGAWVFESLALLLAMLAVGVLPVCLAGALVSPRRSAVASLGEVFRVVLRQPVRSSAPLLADCPYLLVILYALLRLPLVSAFTATLLVLWVVGSLAVLGAVGVSTYVDLRARGGAYGRAQMVREIQGALRGG